MGIRPEYSAQASTFFKTSMFAGDPEALYDYGVRVEGKEGRKNKATNLIKDIREGTVDITGVDYVRSNTKGDPGYFVLNTPDENLIFPLTGERGKDYAMELAVYTQSKEPINDAFDYAYDAALEEGKGTVPVSDFLGAELPGFSDVNRNIVGNQVVYSAYSEEAGKNIEAYSPYELLQKIATLNYLIAIKTNDTDRVNVSLKNPYIEYLTRILRRNYTPKDIKEITGAQIMELLSLPQ